MSIASDGGPLYSVGCGAIEEEGASGVSFQLPSVGKSDGGWSKRTATVAATVGRDACER